MEPGPERPDADPAEALTILLWLVAYALAWVVGVALLVRVLT
jgi:hypothetical protein